MVGKYKYVTREAYAYNWVPVQLSVRWSRDRASFEPRKGASTGDVTPAWTRYYSQMNIQTKTTGQREFGIVAFTDKDWIIIARETKRNNNSGFWGMKLIPLLNRSDRETEMKKRNSSYLKATKMLLSCSFLNIRFNTFNTIFLCTKN